MLKKLWIISLFIPFIGSAQCPEWIGAPLKNSLVLMGLVEQLVSTKFTDSSITSSRDKMIYNDSAGRFIYTLTLRDNKIESIYFEAPNESMQTFKNWFKKEYLSCSRQEEAQSIVFPNSIVLFKPIGTARTTFYLSGR